MKEIWKDITNYEGMYQISNKGRVRSLNRSSVGKDKRTLRFKGKVLSNCISNRGYNTTSLCKNGRSVRFLVHRLVAVMFIPNPHNLPFVLHGPDDNPDNNHINNLRWGTAKDNSKDMMDRDRQYKPTGSKHHRSILTEEDVPIIRSLLKDGKITQQEIADRYGVGRSCITGIKFNRLWNHV